MWGFLKAGSDLEGPEPSEKGKLLSGLQNAGCDFCNMRSLSSNFISLQRVFSKIVTVSGVFLLQGFHLLMRQTLACESGQ